MSVCSVKQRTSITGEEWHYIKQWNAISSPLSSSERFIKGQIVTLSPLRDGGGLEIRCGNSDLSFQQLIAPTQITDISSSNLFFYLLFIGGKGWGAFIIYKDCGATKEWIFQMYFIWPQQPGGLWKVYSAACQYAFPRIGCDIKLNRLLTGRWVDNEAARMPTHQLTDPTCHDVWTTNQKTTHPHLCLLFPSATFLCF